MKPKSQQINSQFNSQAGFALVELLAVLAIMTIILGALVIDFAGQRGRRNIVLAGNETVTNLRKVQSKILSSKNISDGVPAKYYIAEFKPGETKYTVQAIDNNYTFYDNLETISLPSKVSISSMEINLPEGDQIIQKETTDSIEVKKETESLKCLQVIFSAPFGRMYTNSANKCGSTIVDTLKDPVRFAELNQNTVKIYFSESSGTASQSYLELAPITGQMTVH